MEVTELGRDGSIAHVRARVSYADYKEAYNKRLREKGRGIQVRGFRPGKSPRGLLQRAFGGDILRECVSEQFKSGIEDYYSGSHEVTYGSFVNEPGSDTKLNLDGNPNSNTVHELDVYVGVVSEPDIAKDGPVPVYAIEPTEEEIEDLIRSHLCALGDYEPCERVPELVAGRFNDPLLMFFRLARKGEELPPFEPGGSVEASTPFNLLDSEGLGSAKQSHLFPVDLEDVSEAIYADLCGLRVGDTIHVSILESLLPEDRLESTLLILGYDKEDERSGVGFDVRLEEIMRQVPVERTVENLKSVLERNYFLRKPVDLPDDEAEIVAQIREHQKLFHGIIARYYTLYFNLLERFSAWRPQPSGKYFEVFRDGFVDAYMRKLVGEKVEELSLPKEQMFEKELMSASTYTFTGCILSSRSLEGRGAEAFYSPVFVLSVLAAMNTEQREQFKYMKDVYAFNQALGSVVNSPKFQDYLSFSNTVVILLESFAAEAGEEIVETLSLKEFRRRHFFVQWSLATMDNMYSTWKCEKEEQAHKAENTGE